MRRYLWILLAALLSPAIGNGAPFSYQGHLTLAGQPASGVFDLQVGLFTAAVGGDQLGNNVLLNGVEVHGGAFTVELEFGTGVFDGQGRWLDIAVRSAGVTQFTALKPRQALTAVPYAQYALTPAGPRGEKGDPGVPGPMGQQGPAGLKWRGAYDAFSGYHPGDALEFEGESWVATEETPIGEAPHALGRKWNLLAARGDKGAQGERGETGAMGPPGPLGLNWRGAWDATIFYHANDVVEYDGESWIAVAPPMLSLVPNDFNRDFQRLARKGATGPQGPKGDSGPKGDPGVFPTTGSVGVNVASPFSGVGLHVGPPPGNSDTLLLGGEMAGTLMVFGQTAANQGANYIGSIKTSGTWGELQLNPSGGSVSVGRRSGANLEVNGTVNALRFIGDGVGLTNVPRTLAETTVVSAWGDNLDGQTRVPGGLSQVLAIAGGGSHTVALTKERKVIAWGLNVAGQCTVPPTLSDVAAIAAGLDFTLALRREGTVVAWGASVDGKTEVPAELTDVVAIAAGRAHGVALRSTGKVVVWGNNTFDQRNVPNELGNVVRIAAGFYHTLALRGDGTVVAWGNNFHGQLSVPADLGLVSEIAAGGNNCLALLRDGTVVVWGENESGSAMAPAGLKSVTAISVGESHFHALKSDGTLVSWGANQDGAEGRPNGLTGVTSVAAGNSHVIVTKKTPTVSGDLLIEGQVMALSFNTTSDRNAKENLVPVDSREVLERVASLPINRWNFKGNSGETHLGPMAQDFRAAFGLGTDERHIATVDADGVALAAIQALHQKLEEQRRENAALRRDVEALMAQVLRLSAAGQSKSNP